MDWAARADAAIARHRAGSERDADQRQLTQRANSAWAAGLCLLMAGDRDDGATWLRHAAACYRESWDAGAPAGSWGRPIAALKALVLAGDDAADAARWALDAGAAASDSPIGRYAAALALLVLGDDDGARAVAASLDDPEFPAPVAAALGAIAAADGDACSAALEELLVSFEERTEYLEDVPVADTVLVLHALAAVRGLAEPLRPSRVLP